MRRSGVGTWSRRSGVETWMRRSGVRVYREGRERGMRTGREGWEWRKKKTWREEIEKGMRSGK